MTFYKVPLYVGFLAIAISSVVMAQNSNTATTPQSGQHQAGPKQLLSPRGQSECSFADGNTVKVDYGRPYIRNRKIMGGLVPYGKVWRTGANEATSFETQAPLTIGGTAVPAGKYTLYTLPSEGTWKLIINKQTGQWGTVYNQAQDLARIDMKMQHLDTPVDQFTITSEQRGPKSCLMKLEWENTSASVDLDEAAAAK
jgi:hypothetical protein